MITSTGIYGASSTIVTSDLYEDVEKLKIHLYTNRPVDYETIFQTWSQAGIKKCGKPFVLSNQNFIEDNNDV